MVQQYASAGISTLRARSGLAVFGAVLAFFYLLFALCAFYLWWTTSGSQAMSHDSVIFMAIGIMLIGTAIALYILCRNSHYLDQNSYWWASAGVGVSAVGLMMLVATLLVYNSP